MEHLQYLDKVVEEKSELSFTIPEKDNLNIKEKVVRKIKKEARQEKKEEEDVDENPIKKSLKKPNGRKSANIHSH